MDKLIYDINRIKIDIKTTRNGIRKALLNNIMIKKIYQLQKIRKLQKLQKLRKLQKLQKLQKIRKLQKIQEKNIRKKQNRRGSDYIYDIRRDIKNRIAKTDNIKILETDHANNRLMDRANSELYFRKNGYNKNKISKPFMNSSTKNNNTNSDSDSDSTNELCYLDLDNFNKETIKPTSFNTKDLHKTRW
jgi:hypothetical protein